MGKERWSGENAAGRRQGYEKSHYENITVTVNGILKNGKGTIEFDAGCTLVSVG